MKNLALTILCISLFINSFSQNYSYNKTFGTSPDYQFSTVGKTIIERPPSEAIEYDDTLSSWQTLPFSWFYFGVPVTGYFVSENGYITFDANATTSISAKSSIPDIGGPNNAIYAFWEDLVISKRASLNDKIRSWTYGEAPNRIHVIQWYCVKPKTNPRYLNMAIRLYECGDFDIVFPVGSGFGFSTGAIGCENIDGTIGISIPGSPYVGYPKVTTPQSDDVVYTFYNDQNNYDLSVISSDFSDYVPLGNYTIKGEIENKGASTVTSFKLNYSINSGAVQTMNLSSVNIPAFGGTFNYSHNIPWNVTNSGIDYVVRIWADDINGNADERVCNDTNITEVFSGISGDKKVLIEEFTYTTCGFCPDGMLRMDSLIHELPGEVFGVSVHKITTKDLMGFAGTTDIISTFNVTGYPTGMVNRILYPGNTKEPFSRYEWKNATYAELNKYTPLNVSISHTFNPGTRLLDATVVANFVDDAEGDMRFVLMILEDSVTGDANYDQKSYFNGTFGHPYYQKGDTLFGYVHKHVLRALPSGATGNAGFIASNVTLGSTYSENFTYTIPDSYDLDHISLIGFVANYGGVGERNILNVIQEDLSEIILGIDEESNVPKLYVYPNPANDMIILKTEFTEPTYASICIHNLFGQEVLKIKEGTFKKGKHEMDVAVSYLNEGIYLLSVKTEKGILTEKIIIQK